MRFFRVYGASDHERRVGFYDQLLGKNTPKEVVEMLPSFLHGMGIWAVGGALKTHFSELHVVQPDGTRVLVRKGEFLPKLRDGDRLLVYDGCFKELSDRDLPYQPEDARFVLYHRFGPKLLDIGPKWTPRLTVHCLA